MLSNLRTEYSSTWTVPPDEWCADFVSFCFTVNGQVGTGKAIPRWQRAASQGYKLWLDNEYGNSCLKGNYVPKPGDVLVYGSYSHVGLVYACDGNYVYAVEGNTRGTAYYNTVVSLTKHSLDSGAIYGYYPTSQKID